MRRREDGQQATDNRASSEGKQHACSSRSRSACCLNSGLAFPCQGDREHEIRDDGVEATRVSGGPPMQPRSTRLPDNLNQATGATVNGAASVIPFRFSRAATQTSRPRSLFQNSTTHPADRTEASITQQSPIFHASFQSSKVVWFAALTYILHASLLQVE
jgi:hypothetical protein